MASAIILLLSMMDRRSNDLWSLLLPITLSRWAVKRRTVRV